MTDLFRLDFEGAAWEAYEQNSGGAADMSLVPNWDGVTNALQVAPIGNGPFYGIGGMEVGDASHTEAWFSFPMYWSADFPSTAKDALGSGTYKPFILHRVDDAPGGLGDARMILQMREFEPYNEGNPPLLLAIYLNNNVGVSNAQSMPANRRSVSVDIGTNTLSTPASHQFVTCDQVVYTNEGGTTIGGLTPGDTYFVISAFPTYPATDIPESTDFQVALTAEDAVAGTAIDLTDAGSGTHLFTRTQSLVVDGNTGKWFWLKMYFNIATRIYKLFLYSEDGVFNQVQASGDGSTSQAFRIVIDGSNNPVYVEQPCDGILLQAGKIIDTLSSWLNFDNMYYESVPGWTQPVGNTAYFIQGADVVAATTEAEANPPSNFGPGGGGGAAAYRDGRRRGRLLPLWGRG